MLTLQAFFEILIRSYFSGFQDQEAEPKIAAIGLPLHRISDVLSADEYLFPTQTDFVGGIRRSMSIVERTVDRKRRITLPSDSNLEEGSRVAVISSLNKVLITKDARLAKKLYALLPRIKNQKES